MWNLVNQYISEAIHDKFEFTRKTQLPSNHKSKNYQIENDKHRFLVKVDHVSALERYECEADNHTLLTRDSDFLVADPITIGSSLEYCFSVYEWLPSQPDKEDWYLCGKTLAKMHSRHEQEMFGFEQDNYFLGLAQPNQWHKKWSVFFAEERIAWQLQLLQEKNIVLVEIDNFVEYIKPLVNHPVQPSLLHGFFWRGNIAFSNDKPSVYCPACYYGDREVDLAHSELFAQLPEAFYTGYNEAYEIDKGYQQRKPIYQLYSLLCHANVFAGDYVLQSKQQIEHILK
ncbi:fructosamine kinase [Pseudoalteromonas luteoviolacea]|uniref:Fructosamine kinase n=1 Tax=Pseudoalteromonas luteoviolacea TaxID=43657 RepID=A0A0C1QCM9_9GAMM|nr:fructosamine kinase family protein [Pseudoalteromonas luteoviolacea]KID57165.1 fructosamine kinase [Pseudoalteromonas luteoviolacea]